MSVRSRSLRRTSFFETRSFIATPGWSPLFELDRTGIRRHVALENSWFPFVHPVATAYDGQFLGREVSESFLADLKLFLRRLISHDGVHRPRGERSVISFGSGMQ